MDRHGAWELANPHLPAWIGYAPEKFKGIGVRATAEIKRHFEKEESAN